MQARTQKRAFYSLILTLMTLLTFFMAFPEQAEGKVIESRLYRWWGGAPACLDIHERDASPGKDIQLYPCHNEPHQNWKYDEGKGFLRLYKNNVCMDLHEGVVREGQRIQLWNCWDGDPQKFRYDERAHLIRYRRDENFCVSLDDDTKGLHLARCDQSSVFQSFEIKNGYGDRKLHDVTFVTTHNAHVSGAEARWLFPNQSRSLDRQLEEGVRGLMIDTYSRNGEVELCHGDCNGFPGIGYANPRLYLAQVFDKVTRYMNEYPDVIITLILEDYANEGDMRALLDRSPEVRRLLFNPYAEGVREKGWPTVNEMIARNKRLLIITSRDDKKHLGFAFARDFTVENYWSLGALGNNTECKKRWDDIPLDKTYGPMIPLFVFNQFRDVPTTITASLDNRAQTLLDRVQDKCLPAAKKRPNFVSVDFYEAANNGVFKVVETINNSVAVLFDDANYGGRSQLLTPGEYNVDHLRVGNDKTTSILFLAPAAVDVYDHGRFDGWLGRFTSSSPNIGADWNDRISSVRVEFR